MNVSLQQIKNHIIPTKIKLAKSQHSSVQHEHASKWPHYIIYNYDHTFTTQINQTGELTRPRAGSQTQWKGWGLSRGPHLQRPEVPVDVPDVRRDRRLRRFGARRPRVQRPAHVGPARGVFGLPPLPRLLRLGLRPRRRPRPRLGRPRRRAVVRVRSGGRGELGQGLALPARPIERRRRVRGVLLALHRLRLRPPPPDPHAAANGRDGRADSFLRLPWLSAGVCRVWFGSGDE